METYPFIFVAIMCTLLGIEILIGLSLNLYIVAKWFFDRKQGKKTRNRSNGNNFITTLKAMDLIICVAVIPTTIVVLVIDKEKNLVACFIKEGFVMFASSGSAVCVLLVSLDRYSAAVLPTKPLFSNRSVQLCRLTVFIAAVLGLSLPLFSLFMGAYHWGTLQSMSVLPCRSVIWLFKPYYLYEVVYVVYFIITICIVFICYKSVLRVVRRRMEARTSIITGGMSGLYMAKMRKQELKATRRTFAVVLSFLVCWGPHVIVTLIQFGLPHSIVVDMIQGVSLCLAYLTPIVHPAIYPFDTNSGSCSEGSVTSTGTSFFHIRSGSRKVTPETPQKSGTVVQHSSHIYSNHGVNIHV